MFFCNRRLVRTTACYLLLQTLSTVFGPVVALAGNGPMQPEFTSYNPGGSDLVDLLTGDFSYTLPLLDIPGPERSFSIPLSYKSGIKLEQEASWVGLGWTLNAGAVSRTPNGYPDDASGDKVQTHFLKHVGAIKDVDYIPGVWHNTTDIYTGKTIGQVDLIGLAGFNWDNDGIVGGDIIGIGYQKGEGPTMDPIRMALGALTIMSFGGAFASSTAAKATSALGKAAESVGGQAAISFASQVGLATAVGSMSLGKLSGAEGAGNQLQIYNFNSGTYASFLIPFVLNPHTDYTYSLYGRNTDETTFGSLYFGKMSQRTTSVPSQQVLSPLLPPITRNRIHLTTNTGAAIAPVEFTNTRIKAPLDDAEGPGIHVQETAADIHQPAGTAYENVDGPGKPISIAHDYFSVMGGGASGLIRPYRMDVGSVVAVSAQTQNFKADTKYMAVPFQDYKVGFRYEGDLSNTYDYHQNTDPADIGLRVSLDKRSIIITDQRLFDATLRTAPTRQGIVNGVNGPRFVQGKNIQWFSNQEIEQMGSNASASEFLDFAQPVADASSANSFRHRLPPAGIGAFKVTTEDGTTYHYSLPVYEYKTNTYSNEINAAYKTMYGLPGEYFKKEGVPTTTNPHGGYATTWLLTAITSSDYIDRNSSGIVDAQDWGGWVKLQYGKFSSQYKWRQPYIGYSYSDETGYIDYTNFMEGYRESYYLDRISTRTHTALFIKSIREDGKGHFNASYQPGGSHDMDINEQFPASSLRLDEIILLDNNTLAQLQTPNGIAGPNPTTPVPALSNDTGGNASANSCTTCGDDLAGILDGRDLTADARIREFIEANSLKRIRFNYDYDLCRGVPNSFSYTLNQSSSLPPMTEAQASMNRSGKLTLKSVSSFGPTVAGVPTKIIPDFIFGYDAPGVAADAVNPRYQKDKWDGFGMYNAQGQYNVVSHTPTVQAYAAPWTLTSITDPLGGVTHVAYERDEYSHISEMPNESISFRTNNVADADDNIVLTLSNDELAKIQNRIRDVVHIGDKISLSGFMKYTCTTINNGSSMQSNERSNFYNIQKTVIAIPADNQILLSGEFDMLCQGTPFLQAGVVHMALPINKPGGDVRVAAITTTEPTSGAQYELRYKYSAGSRLTGNSTGVIAQPAPFAKSGPATGYEKYDYPQTPVLYSLVSVLHGPFRSNDELTYSQREVFEFYTPASTMLTQDLAANSPTGGGGVSDFWNEATQRYDGIVSFSNNRIKVSTGLIGRPKAVRIYNQQGQLELSTDFQYANQVANPDNIAKQGYYTEGVLANHMLNNSNYSVNRTTKVYEPTVLVGTTTMRNGVVSQSRNVMFDFFTGQAVETAQTNSLGKTYHTRIVPAYTLPGQTAMGPKGADGANRNMLVQAGASYTYVEAAGGPAYDPQNFLNPKTSHVLSAAVQLWQPNWTNYREADANGDYQDVAGQTPVWRQAAAYAWQSPSLAPDGSFNNFVPFVWSGTPNAHWLKAGEAVRYDHYSHPLESRDVNGLYSASKTGHEQSQILASAANAKYSEVAYSGAEDMPTLINGQKHFGSEVVTDGVPVAGSSSTGIPLAHTGTYSTKLNGGNKLKYRATAGAGVLAGKAYRLSAWIHASDLPTNAGRLYASVNGSVLKETSITATETKKAGVWYRLLLEVTIPAGTAGQAVEFGCRNSAGAGAVYVDDFRVCPVAATMTSQVYNPRTNRLTHTLDNENLFTRYDYSNVGRLTKVFKERFDRPNTPAPNPVLVKEYEQNYGQMHAPVWRTDAYNCETDSYGNNTGVELRHVVDVNPLNNPPTTAKWEANGYSPTCAPPSCPTHEFDNDGHLTYVRRLRNNVCEEAQRQGPACEQVYQSGTFGYNITYTWVFANGDSEEEHYFSTNSCVQFRSNRKKASDLTKPSTSFIPIKRHK
jgi:hypothetical protein